MQKNEIVGIKPYNGLLYRSCYYVQMFSALAALELDTNDFLLSYCCLPQKDFNYKEIDFCNYKKFRKTRDYEVKKVCITENLLKKMIDKNIPIMASVDCFYLESRAETYNVYHAPHYILVYGYDFVTRTIKVIDHDFNNSWKYYEKTISLDNLLLANKMFKKIFGKECKPDRIILKRKIKFKNQLCAWDFLNRKILEDSYHYSKENLKYLKEMLSYKSQNITTNISKYLEYFTKLKSQYFIFVNTNNIFDDIKEDISKIISCYNYIQSFFMKLKFVEDINKLKSFNEGVIRKIDELLLLEETIHWVVRGMYDELL